MTRRKTMLRTIAKTRDNGILLNEELDTRIQKVKHWL